MNGVFVTVRYDDDFDEIAVRKIADGARHLFEGMPGLRSKAFTFNGSPREVINFYVWDNEDAAKAFFTEDTTKRITEVYGRRPQIQFVDIAATVENGRS
jgi:heme-degrading monooxygenase HmoA